MRIPPPLIPRLGKWWRCPRRQPPLSGGCPKGFSNCCNRLTRLFLHHSPKSGRRPRFAPSLPSENLRRPFQRYQGRVLPQGMKNSPSLGPKFVDQALKPARQAFNEAYLIHCMDDILFAHPDLAMLPEILIQTTDSAKPWAKSGSRENSSGATI